MRRFLHVLAWAIGGYLVLAYLILPALWRHYEHAPEMAALPKVTRTVAGIPGDPVNVALVGTEAEVLAAFAAAGWSRPVAIGLRSSIAIAESVVRDRPDLTAPVSHLFLFGRHEDLAFELETGSSARQRNHVRFWRTAERVNGAPLWLGAATFDQGVGVSHLTGQITHHIAPDLDAERERVIAALTGAGQLRSIFQVTGIGATVTGRNGGGDWYFTDGEIDVGVLKTTGTAAVSAPDRPKSPPVVAKNAMWRTLRRLLMAITPARRPAPQSG